MGLLCQEWRENHRNHVNSMVTVWYSIMILIYGKSIYLVLQWFYTSFIVVDDGLNDGELYCSSGWWFTYPSEKYEFVKWDDDIPN